MGKASNKKANKALEALYDLLHSSPTKTTLAVRSLELEIKNRISELENVVEANDDEAIVEIVKEMTRTIEERNRKLKASQ